jgi:hypothetical protein
MRRITPFIPVLILLSTVSGGAQEGPPIFNGAILFSSVGPGHAQFQLAEDTFVDAVEIEQIGRDGPYGIVLSGPNRFHYISWEDFRFPPIISPSGLTYPLKAGLYHAYAIAEVGKPLHIQVRLRGLHAPPAELTMKPHEGNAAVRHSGLPDLVPVTMPTLNVAVERGVLPARGPSMVVSMELAFVEGALASAYASWHSVHQGIGESQCQPGSITVTLASPNVSYGFGVATSILFLVDYGEQQVQVLSAVPGTAIVRSRASVSMVVSLTPDDPFHHYEPKFWQQVFGLHPLLESIPPETRQAILRLACTPGYLPLQP